MREGFLITSGKEKTVAESIIRILSKDWPLTLKEVHRKVVGGGKQKVSPQATHKALKGLVKNQVLTKKGFHYELNSAWLEQLSHFSQAAIRKKRAKKES